ncbi:MAG: hypothetical protein ACI8RD_003915 [Bacillariaceae sp.]|jgi:hypothetical protein
MLDAMDEIEEGGVKSKRSIVCWQPHGKAFMVLKPKDFVGEVMPHFFNQTKYASFQRQLNLYGFSRLTHGPDKGAYYHNCFVRDQRYLCKGMVRQKIKGTKVRKSLSPEDEPNFYTEDHKRGLATFCQQQQQENSSSSVQQPHDNVINNISQDNVKSLKSSSPRMNMISSEDSLVSLIPIIPSNNPNNMKTPSSATTTNSSLNTTLNTIYSSEGMDTSTTKTSSSSFPSNSRSDYFSPDIIMNTTISPLPPRIVSPHNRTVSFDNHRQQQQQQQQQKQVYPVPVTPTEIIKGGDLLFFEGQPFRYLEHFEEVPHNNNTCNNNNKKNENNMMMKRQMMISKSKRNDCSSTSSSSSSSVQATRDTTNTVTDKFHDMISNIMLNIDSSSSSSSSPRPCPFQNVLHQRQNTSCPV